MLYVHITVLPTNSSDNIIFKFYEEDEEITYSSNIFKLSNDGNGILIQYDPITRTSKCSIVSPEYNFSVLDSFYTYDMLLEEYHKYRN